jgi:uncharacterized heparinase superfamily protein
MTIAKMRLYWHTLRHLRLIQFYRRIWFKFYKPNLNFPITKYSRRLSTGDWQLPVAGTPLMLGAHQFIFLNHIHTLPEAGGWNDVALEKLWLYNLHYFDDLNACDAVQRSKWHKTLITRWIQENPPASGNGWESYPTSLRMVNWIKWLAAGNVPVSGMLESLVIQTNWLEKRLEKHLLGNHLFANAKALVFAGLFFDGLQSTRWLAVGLNLIDQQLPEQVLADGGNFERSTMYHAIFLEDMLDLINASKYWQGFVSEEKVNQWCDVANRMLAWLDGLTHPDGEIALFNDAAFSIAPRVCELRAYAQQLVGFHSTHDEAIYGRLKLIHYADSGYVRLEAGNAVGLLDVAPVGPDYLPGHAHADTLSFELSLFGRRVIVNGGTSCYGIGLERLQERGTANHSTVEVDRQNSSEVWGGFRVACRAYPFDLKIQDEIGELKVACSHDGYKRLTGSPVHRREWQMTSKSLIVTDLVDGGEHVAVARYILHPDVKVIEVGCNEWLLELLGGESVRIIVLAGSARLEKAKYAPEFGKILPTKSLEVDLIEGFARTQLIWH